MYLIKKGQHIVYTAKTIEELENKKAFADYDNIEETSEEYVLFLDEGRYVSITDFLKIKKQLKTKEALDKANAYINNEALFEFKMGKHIEATTDNVAKLTSYLIGLQQGIYKEIIWITKEDEEVILNLDQVIAMLQGIAQVQSEIWTVKYKDYIAKINNANNIKDLEAININYGDNLDG